MVAERSDAFVFFGATGDLAFKQIFPALLGLIRDDGFDVPIIGVARSGDLESLRERARRSVAAAGAERSQVPLGPRLSETLPMLTRARQLLHRNSGAKG